MNSKLQLAILAIMIAGVALIYYFGGPDMKNIAMGVGSSIFASIIFAAFFQYFDYDSKFKELGDVINSLEDVQSYHKELVGYEKIKINGLMDVRPKHAGGNTNYWSDVLASSKGSLDIVGNCLSGWVNPSCKVAFEETVIRIVTSNGTVRVMVLNFNGSDAIGIKTDLFGRNYKNEVETFLKFCIGIKAKLVQKHGEEVACRFIIKVTNDYLAYSFLYNGENMYISHYMQCRKPQNSMLLKISTSSMFAADYLSDIAVCFERGSDYPPVRIS